MTVLHTYFYIVAIFLLGTQVPKGMLDKLSHSDLKL